MSSSNKLFSCGYNAFGQLGFDSGRRDVLKFTEIKNVPKNIKAISSGYINNTTILCDGTLLTCGQDRQSSKYRSSFDKINVFKEIVQIAASCSHMLILAKDGTLMGCGSNGYGALSSNDTYISEFRQIYDQDVVQIACGYDFTIILKVDGTLMACGKNTSGQLGLGSETHIPMLEVVNAPKDIIQIACGGNHTIIMRSDGTLMAAGANDEGQLGLGDTHNRYVFTEIKNLPKDIIQIACGEYHSVIMRSNYTVMSCGYNYYGQLGLGDNISRTEFTEAHTSHDSSCLTM